MKKYCATLFGFIVTATSSVAGPFGIEVDKFNPQAYGCNINQPGYYVCDGIENKHPDIEQYVVQFYESVGLCMIKGISFDIDDSRYGSNIMSKFDRIHAQLKPKYGDGNDVKFLKSGSIWNESEDWMMGLSLEERVHAVLWEFPQPIDDVKEIVLAAKALSSSKGYFIIEFHTEVSSKCDEVESSDAAGVF